MKGFLIIDHCPDAGNLCDNQNTASVPEFLYGNAEYCSCQWNAAVKGFMGAKIDASVAPLKNTLQNHELEPLRCHINQANMLINPGDIKILRIQVNPMTYR